MCGTKPSSQSNTTSTTSPTSWAAQAYQNTVGQAEQLAQTPYQAYSGELVAPVNSQQTAGINAINSTAGTQNPYNTSATGLLNSGATALNPGTVGQQQISQYESPYQQDVVNSTMAEINNQNAQQSAALQGNVVASGAMGGDRAGVAQAALAGQQALASNQTLASLNNQNYQQALTEANTQQQTGLQAQEQTATNQLNAGNSLGNLGNTAVNEALGIGNAQTNAGTLQQQTSQAADTANYNQYLQQLGYPYQQLSWLSGIEGGLGSLAGGTTSSGTTQQTSALSGILGGGLGLLSLLARGGRIEMPKKASGGGLGGAVTPYSDNSGEVAPGAGSWIPTTTSIDGHSTMPSAGGSGGMQQAASPMQTAQQIQQMGKSVSSGLGNLSSLGSNLSFAANPDSTLAGLGGGDATLGSMMLPFKRGGAVGHYDDGGTVAPDGLMFDPSAIGNGVGSFIPNAAQPATAQAAPIAVSGSNDDGTFGRMVNAESGGQQFASTDTPLISPKGAVGIAQIEPSTAPEAAAAAGLPFDEQKLYTDPAYNAALGKAYYGKMLDEFGSPDKAAAAYNAGPGAVSSALAQADKNGGSYLDYLPQETQSYVAKVMGGNGGSGGDGLGDVGAAPGTALAYDDQGNPISAGLAAISSALHPSGVNLASMGQGQGQSQPSAIDTSVGATGQGRSGLLGLNLPDADRMGLLAAGLGIMGGTSVNPLVNIGQGGLAGIQAMQNAAKTQAEVGLERQQASQIQTENQIKRQQLGLMMKALQNNSDIFKSQAESGSPTTAQPVTPLPATGGAGNTTSLNGVPSINGAPSAGASSGALTKTVSPQYDPVRLRAAAENMSFVNPQAAANYRAQAQAIESGQSVVQFTDGSWGKLPGYDAAAAGTAGAEAGAKANAESQYDLVQVQPKPGDPIQYIPKSQVLKMTQEGQAPTPVGPGAGSPPGGALDAAASASPVIASQPGFYAKKQDQIATDENIMKDQFMARQVARQRLQTLSGILQNYQPGAFSEEKADLVASLRGAGIDVPDSATANPTAFQEFMKNATANVFDQVKSMGGRVLVSEIAGLTKANANAGLQPAAAAAIIGQGIGLLNYEDKHYQDYTAWKNQPQNMNATTTAPFEINWVKNNPVQPFVESANKNIAYAGQAIPPAAQRSVGQAYKTPKGIMRWMGNGWAPVAAQ